MASRRWLGAALAAALLGLTFVATACVTGGGGESGSGSGTTGAQEATPTRGSTAEAVSDEDAVKAIVEEVYGAMAAKQPAVIKELLTGKAAGYEPEIWQSDVKLVGIEITSAKVSGNTAEVNVVERVEDEGGNAGVTQALYKLEKTPEGWKISEAEFGD